MFYGFLIFSLLAGNGFLMAEAGNQLSPSRQQSQETDQDDLESDYGDDSGTGEVDEDIIIEQDVDTNDDEGVPS